MIYRYSILAESGLYDGWAHDADEMRAKFNTEYPEPCHIFFYGGEPLTLNYRQYTYLLNVLGDSEKVKLWDRLFIDHVETVKGLDT